MAELGEELGLGPVDTLFALLEEDPATLVWQEQFSAASVREFLRHPRALVGSDSFALDAVGIYGLQEPPYIMPHPNTYCAAVSFLTGYAPGSLAGAVHQLTGRPARRLGLERRGLIAEGYQADITVFTPGALRTNESFCEPRSFPSAYAMSSSTAAAPSRRARAPPRARAGCSAGGEDMRITGMRCRRFDMRLKRPIKVASGEISSGGTVLVRLDTDAGLYGLGEGSGVPFVHREDCEDVLSGVERLAEAAMGRSPFEIQAVHAAMDAIYSGHTAAKAAIDTALFDLMAKAAGLPLYRFLGGSCPVVETDRTIALAAPEDMAAEGRRAGRPGLPAHQDKDRRGPRGGYRGRAAHTRGRRARSPAEAGREPGCWTAPTARRVMRALASCGIDALEQPLPARDLHGMSALRRALDTPLMADESCFSPEDAANIVRLDAAELINIKLMKSAGFIPRGR